MPLRPLGGTDRLLEDWPGIFCSPLLHQGNRQRQLGAGPQLDRDGPGQHPRNQRLGPGAVAVEQTHLRLREGQLERRRGISRLFEEVIDRPLQAAGDDPKILGGGLGATELDLVEEGSAEVLAGYRGEAEAQLLASLANPTSKRTRRPGVVRTRTPRAPLSKHNLQSNDPDLTAEARPYRGFGQTSAQESTAEAMTSRIQGERKRRTVPTSSTGGSLQS